MKHADYIYQNFCDALKKSDEVTENLGEQILSEEFIRELFYVCEKVSSIGINAPKIKVSNTTQIQASFQYVDIDDAVSHIIRFSRKYPDLEVKGLLDVIRQVHRYAYSENNTNKLYGTVWDDSSSMRIGSFHNFAELPEDIWLKLCRYTEYCIGKGTDPDRANSAVFTN